MNAVCCDGLDRIALEALHDGRRRDFPPSGWDHPLGRAILRRHRWLQLRGRWVDRALAGRDRT